jgi:acetyl esterase/lipase
MITDDGRIDPELAAALAADAQVQQTLPPEPRGDIPAWRAWIELASKAYPAPEPAPGVTATGFTAVAPDGADVPLVWFTPADRAEPGPAWLYVHGGGMVLGSVALDDSMIRQHVAQTGVPMLAPDYRLAPEHPHPAPVEDCYAALVHLTRHAGELGVDPSRIGVTGFSAGGGLAAAVTLLARDRGGPAIARQLLVYPMLDDRTTLPDPAIAPYATWTYEDNALGWRSLLGDLADDQDVPWSAAAARATDLTGLPPAYVETAELDIFRTEDVVYAERLAAAGVPVELHLHPGCVHGFDGIAPDAAVTRRATADRYRVLRSL